MVSLDRLVAGRSTLTGKHLADYVGAAPKGASPKKASRKR